MTQENQEMAKGREAVDRTAEANTSGNQFQAAGETWYDFKVGNAIVGLAAICHPDHRRLHRKQCRGLESQGGQSDPSVDSLQTGAGARVSYKAKVGNVTVKPQLSVVWQHEFSNNTRGVNARLAQGRSTMNWRTDKIGQNFALISVDVPVKVTKNLVANIGYTAEVGRDKSTNPGLCRNNCL